jgi:hypothetical protein
MGAFQECPAGAISTGAEVASGTFSRFAKFPVGMMNPL